MSTLSRRLLQTREIHPNSATTDQILDRSATIIETHGLAHSAHYLNPVTGDPSSTWLPGYPTDVAGAIAIVCGTPSVDGAQHVAGFGPHAHGAHPAYVALAEHLGHAHVDGIFDWLDGRDAACPCDRCRPQAAADVVQALRDCARQLRERAA
ncbi:DUF6197 family protein [Pseudonocardia pini]|uniref:DUF6197 family protein n=1 Tax=Pseudonocardia pini TaxID=2758030 RepID=UPI0015F0DC16|nr:hypothetical protein [Pseudonocardia pini]